jgi:hypothetical protein
MDPILTISTNQIDKSSYNMRMLLWGLLSAVILLLLLWSNEMFFIIGVAVAVFTPMFFSKLFEGDLRSSVEIAFYPDGIAVNDDKFNYKDLRKIKAFKTNKGSFIYTHFWAKDGSENRWVFYNAWIKQDNLQDIFTRQVRAYNEAAPADEKIKYV